MNPDFTTAADPIALFAAWFAEAMAAEPGDPNAMALATLATDGAPDVRMVLLKGFDAAGFVFYTNAGSTKGGQLAARPAAALAFHWKSLRRQVRVRGAVEPVPAEEADHYFAGRARGSRVGAWASRQSQPLASRGELEAAVAAAEARFAAGDIPRPPHWQGYRVGPASIEFWQERPFRLHDRVRFTRDLAGWTRQRLYP